MPTQLGNSDGNPTLAGGFLSSFLPLLRSATAPDSPVHLSELVLFLRIVPQKSHSAKAVTED